MKYLRMNFIYTLLLLIISLVLILFLELEELYIFRDYVIKIFPFLVGRRLFLSNFCIGIFVSSLVALVPLLTGYFSYSDSLLNQIKDFYLINKERLITNLGSETIEDIKRLFDDGTMSKINEYFWNYSKFLFSKRKKREYYSWNAWKIIFLLPK